jgi:hypothetical protein
VKLLSCLHLTLALVKKDSVSSVHTEYVGLYGTHLFVLHVNKLRTTQHAHSILNSHLLCIIKQMNDHITSVIIKTFSVSSSDISVSQLNPHSWCLCGPVDLNTYWENISNGCHLTLTSLSLDHWNQKLVRRNLKLRYITWEVQCILKMLSLSISQIRPNGLFHLH